MIELSARSFSEISEPEPKATGELSEENFIITENRMGMAIPKI